MSPNASACEVEFLGGPVDGHVEAMLLPLHSFVGIKVLACEENDSFFQSLIKKWHAKPGIRIAIYKLGNTGTKLCYRFLRLQIMSEETLASDAAINSLVEQFSDNDDA